MMHKVGVSAGFLFSVSLSSDGIEYFSPLESALVGFQSVPYNKGKMIWFLFCLDCSWL